ncbi:hypothetical protein GGI12_003659 [Dipsacomyces acuminosporus]|nr:hypothetical protein GGI12_003659 [Dipsacomyces acuminosporus]
MEEAVQRPVTYVAIHERTPAMPILYVSSSVRQAFFYEPQDFIGHSPTEFITDNGDGQEYQRHCGSYSDDNFMTADIVANRKDGTPLLVRSMAFACSNVMFHLVTTYPSANPHEHENNCSIRRFKCNLNAKDAKGGMHILSNGGDSSSSSSLSKNSEAMRDKVFRDIANSIKKAHQACIVLEGLNSTNSGGNKSARIIFTTDSINRIINVDSCDLQGMPFLSLVATRDTIKAGNFLDRALNTGILALERLHLLVDPLEDSQLKNAECVSVEFMAMGSDDGVIMLCQLQQTMHEDDVYMSLEDIISSDPETSDLLHM